MSFQPGLSRCTRERCQMCNKPSSVGFFAPHETWKLVAGDVWANSILCISCFASLGDEKGIQWEEGIKLYPVSLESIRLFRESREGE